jgi:hypothetical protein
MCCARGAAKNSWRWVNEASEGPPEMSGILRPPSHDGMTRLTRGFAGGAPAQNNVNRAAHPGNTRLVSRNGLSDQWLKSEFAMLKNNVIGTAYQRKLHDPEGAKNNAVGCIFNGAPMLGAGGFRGKNRRRPAIGKCALGLRQAGRLIGRPCYPHLAGRAGPQGSSAPMLFTRHS